MVFTDCKGTQGEEADYHPLWRKPALEGDPQKEHGTRQEVTSYTSHQKNMEPDKK